MTSYSELELPWARSVQFSDELAGPAQLLLGVCVNEFVLRHRRIELPRPRAAWVLEVIVEPTGYYEARVGQRPIEEIAANLRISASGLAERLAKLPSQGIVGLYIRGAQGYFELLSLVAEPEVGRARA